MKRLLIFSGIILIAGSLWVRHDALAITLGPDFIADYTAFDLGPVPGVPNSYGGLTLQMGDPSTLLIGGNANTDAGRLFEIGVIRDGDNHITGFSGTATQFGEVGNFNDGGVVFGPDDVLFTAQWNVNNLGQTKPGSTDEDRVDNLAGFGIGGSSISALNFVPSGFPGAGDMKVVTWSSGQWWDMVIAPDGSGTFDITSATQIDLDPIAAGTQNLPGGPEGFVYIDPINPGFSVPSMLVSDFSDDGVSAYELDGDGNPLVSTRRNFLSDLNGAEGAFIDPLTGDFLFSTFGTGTDRVVRVEGFVPLVDELGDIMGIKWNDLDGDGIQDPGELGIADWVMELSFDDDLIATTSTGADGNYAFLNLPVGDYLVTEVLQPGWIQTFDGGAGGTSVETDLTSTVNFGNQFVGLPEPAPEPTTLALIALGLAGIGFIRRRRVNA